MIKTDKILSKESGLTTEPGHVDIIPHLGCEIVESAIDGIARIDLVVLQAEDLDSRQGLGAIAAEHHVAHVLGAAFAERADLSVHAFRSFIDVVDDLFAELELDADAGGVVGDELMDLATVTGKL